MAFNDHFSGQAALYARSRPHYPVELYEYLAGLTSGHDYAWDCATGNGQAAVALSDFYKKVTGTDGSESQIANARPHKNVDYRVALAEDSGLPDHSVDMVTVATALHWFDLDNFYKEVKRVVKPGGVLAAWSYFVLETEPAIQDVLKKLSKDILADYWSPDLKKVASNYSHIPFPFEEITPPKFNAVTKWTLPHMIDYIHTWSFAQKYTEATGKDPVLEVMDEFLGAWGDPATEKTIVWPLILKIGRL